MEGAIARNCAKTVVAHCTENKHELIYTYMERSQTTPGEYYHIYSRGNNKNDIFFDDKDRARFLFLIIHLQSPRSFNNISRIVAPYVQRLSLHIDQETIKEILQHRYVDLISFALMPNHFHLLVCEREENGIAQYMQKTLTAYAKYSNTKYGRSGHIMQGPYRIVHVGTNEQFLHLSAYIHRNPRDLRAWRNKEHSYPWSSYQDFIRTNRWGELLNTSSIHDQFESKEEYRQFVETSGAKERDTLEDILLD